jgi:hypothetical protein
MTSLLLQKVKSISGTVINFLTVFAFLSSGVAEIMPFVRYTAQFIDLEWNTIKAKVGAMRLSVLKSASDGTSLN